MVRGEVEIFWRRYFRRRWRKWKCVEVSGSCWNFGIGILVDCGGRKEIKEKEKGKEIHMRRYFLGREFENNESGGFPGLSRGC